MRTSRVEELAERCTSFGAKWATMELQTNYGQRVRGTQEMDSVLPIVRNRGARQSRNYRRHKLRRILQRGSPLTRALQSGPMTRCYHSDVCGAFVFALCFAGLVSYALSEAISPHHYGSIGAASAFRRPPPELKPTTP